MEFEHKGWTTDITPDEYMGRYFARARITCKTSAAGQEPEMHIERNIDLFETEKQARECARLWAMHWIDERLRKPRDGDERAAPFAPPGG
ncbi:hypothetical protein [Paraburkholderia tropica]|uniref:hypothetical protein n=1 Tax=Paraburkholderia tropica TaxID=92647 RepID=UPI0007EE26D6|nr:hypothetical protein [Paraburkholderia tropica]OBR46144.1 hypothetical protein A6456_37775 [Paraburkholderia tropica]